MGRFLLFAALSSAFAASAALEVRERDGALSVWRNGRELVARVSVDRGPIDDADVKRSFATRSDGTRVWNRWSEEADRLFRLEVVQHAKGTVEITMLGEMRWNHPLRRRLLNLDLPRAALEGKSFRCLSAPKNASPFVYHEEDGRFRSGMESVYARFLSADGVNFDFNPLGPGDESAMVVRSDAGNQLNRNALIGLWLVEPTADGYRFSVGDDVPTAWGGFTGGKIVLREGAFEDYGRIHPLRSFFYNRALEHAHLLAFASPRRGKAYVEGDVPYTTARGYGWAPGGCARRKAVGHPEGAFYSAVTGSGEAVYRFGGLADGYYVLTLAAGNYGGSDMAFSVSANATPLWMPARLAAGDLRTVARALHVTGGTLDLRFSGVWRVSTIGLQPLMGDEEDYSIARGIWMEDGFEPTTLYRNADYRAPFRPALLDETEKMPVPGTESAGEYRAPPEPVERPAADDPRLKWLYTAKMRRFLDNSVSMSEFDEPGSLGRCFDRAFAGQNVKAVMLSGMHSRHTYVNHLDRGVEAVRRACRDLHARGVKVIDHHDATLLWNVCGGFRTLMERLDETILTLDRRLPSWQLCPLNPKFTATYYAYLRRLVEAGVDGFQIDELEFWRHGCLCRHCREAFARDTGWTLPLNECDRAWNDPASPLRRRWVVWRRKAITNWFVGLRRHVKDLREDLVLSIYTTNDGFYFPYPRRLASSDVEDLGRVHNYFGAEMMTRSALRNGRNLLPLAKMRRAVAPKGAAPVWTWYYNVDFANDYFAWGLSTLVGQIPLLSGVRAPPGASEYEKYGAGSDAMALDGAETVAEVALLFSSYSRDWNEERPMRPELMGTAQTLEALHIPYDFVSDATLEAGDLGRYKVLFLGEAQCLSDREVAAVKDFARRGGRVRLSVRAGTRDAWGAPRAAPPFPKTPNYVYAAGTPGAEFELDENWAELKWTFAPDPAREAAFRREVEGWTAGARSWRIEAPDQVFAAVWREARGSYAVHLLNNTGARTKAGETVVPEAPTPAFPPLAEDVVVVCPAAAGTRAAATSPDFSGARILPTRLAPTGERLFTLPKECFKTYTLIRIEQDEQKGRSP